MVFTLSALIAFAVWISPAHANRLGPSWMSAVTVDESRPSGASDRPSPVEQLRRGAIVVLISQETEWTQTPESWMPPPDLAKAI
jgi:hypothetical protein